MLDAFRIYRVRRLADSYGLSFEDWARQAAADEAAAFELQDVAAEEPIDVAEVVERVLADEGSGRSEGDDEGEIADAPGRR